MDITLRNALDRTPTYEASSAGDLITELRWLFQLVEASTSESLTESQQEQYREILPAIRYLRDQLSHVQRAQLYCMYRRRGIPLEVAATLKRNLSRNIFPVRVETINSMTSTLRILIQNTQHADTRVAANQVLQTLATICR